MTIRCQSDAIQTSINCQSNAVQCHSCANQLQSNVIPVPISAKSIPIWCQSKANPVPIHHNSVPILCQTDSNPSQSDSNPVPIWCQINANPVPTFVQSANDYPIQCQPYYWNQMSILDQSANPMLIHCKSTQIRCQPSANLMQKPGPNCCRREPIPIQSDTNPVPIQCQSGANPISTMCQSDLNHVQIHPNPMSILCQSSNVNPVPISVFRRADANPCRCQHITKIQLKSQSFTNKPIPWWSANSVQICQFFFRQDHCIYLKLFKRFKIFKLLAFFPYSVLHCTECAHPGKPQLFLSSPLPSPLPQNSSTSHSPSPTGTSSSMALRVRLRGFSAILCCFDSRPSNRTSMAIPTLSLLSPLSFLNTSRFSRVVFSFTFLFVSSSTKFVINQGPSSFSVSRDLYDSLFDVKICFLSSAASHLLPHLRHPQRLVGEGVLIRHPIRRNHKKSGLAPFNRQSHANSISICKSIINQSVQNQLANPMSILMNPPTSQSPPYNATKSI